jgi:uncharacterized protein (DUF433 family)
MISEITTDSQIMGGEPVFSNTRVPIKILFEYLEGGSTIADFLEQYPAITEQQVQTILREAEVALENSVR